jgi:hypothetical protein
MNGLLTIVILMLMFFMGTIVYLVYGIATK